MKTHEKMDQTSHREIKNEVREAWAGETQERQMLTF